MRLRWSVSVSFEKPQCLETGSFENHVITPRTRLTNALIRTRDFLIAMSRVDQDICILLLLN